MNTLVFNLDNLAVTEYTTPFTGLSGDFESTADGAFKVGGTLDDQAKIVSGFALGLALEASGKQHRAEYLYLHGTGTESASATILDGKGSSFKYTAQPRHAQVSRFVLGRGIRDNYLTVAMSLPGTKPVSIDRLEFEGPESATRRM
jgi:hypothetical protein